MVKWLWSAAMGNADCDVTVKSMIMQCPFQTCFILNCVLSWQRLSDSQWKSGIVQLPFLVSGAYYRDKPLKCNQKYCIILCFTLLVSLSHEWWGISFHSFTLALTDNKNATNAALSLSLVFNVQQWWLPTVAFLSTCARVCGMVLHATWCLLVNTAVKRGSQTFENSSILRGSAEIAITRRVELILDFSEGARFHVQCASHQKPSKPKHTWVQVWINLDIFVWINLDIFDHEYV